MSFVADLKSTILLCSRQHFLPHMRNKSKRLTIIPTMPRRKKEEEEAMSDSDRVPRGAANARERMRMR